MQEMYGDEEEGEEYGEEDEEHMAAYGEEEQYDE